jgi:hypothetical protein
MRLGYRLSWVVVAASLATAAMSQQITVVVNGNNVNFQGQQPIMNADRVLVPLRGVLEKIGANVSWDPSTQTVRAYRTHSDIKLVIGQDSAMVDGKSVNLDVPAQIVRGSTMVPLRFVGEALGEEVHWNSASNTVTINDGGRYDLPDNHPHDDTPVGNNPPPPPPPPHDHRHMIYQAGWVIPVRLSNDLSSDQSNEGDKFSAKVERDSHFPPGTRIDGVVQGVRPRHGDDPGMLELRFYQIDFPNGRSFPIDGTLIDLHDKNIEKEGDHIFAKNTPANNRVAYTGYGAGAGLILGLTSHQPIKGAILGGLLGNLAGAIDKSHASDVHLSAGTEFGVHLLKNADVLP